MNEREVKKRFALAADAQRKTVIRDKDNASLQPRPPAQAKHPAPNLAPPGMSGIKPASRIGRSPAPPKPKRFQLGKGNDLTGTFKPLARPGKDKSRDHDR